MGIDENGLDTGIVWPRATARVPTPHPLLSRPYNDYAEGAIRVVIVRAGVVERSGGTLAVALVPIQWPYPYTSLCLTTST